MTPAARYAAAIEILDQILAGAASEQALLAWARRHRFAGSKDRAAIRDIVFSIDRRRASCAAMGGAMTGRAMVRGYLAQEGIDPEAVFGADRYAPAPIERDEPEVREIESLAAAERADLQPWVWEEFQRDHGESAGEIAEALRHRAPVWLRASTERISRDELVEQLARDGFDPQASGVCATAIKIGTNARRLQAHAAITGGLAEFQDLGPQRAMEMLAISPGTTVLDYCAGGGGKSLAAAARGARVTAHDINAARLKALPERAQRAGAKISITASPTGHYDMVICDVPCSGSGAWRRATGTKWSLTPDDLAGLVTRQKAILEKARQHVAPGGMLVYMTCSLFSAENHLGRESPTKPLIESIYTPLDGADGFYIAAVKSD
ncbi:MAG: RsmB/NOP family class I SAM-dependent RNA methyltransferase [Pseudomonadota bacterium]